MAVTASSIVGIATGLASSGMSFKQAADRKREAQKAKNDIQRLTEDARRKAEKNVLEAAPIVLDSYERAREQQRQQQENIIQNLAEQGQRSVLGGVSGVAAAGVAGDEAIRIKEAEDIAANKIMKLQAEEAVKQQLTQMDIGAAADASMMQRDLMEDRAAALQSGFAGVTQAATNLASMADLYGLSPGDRRAKKVADRLDVMGTGYDKITAAAGKPLTQQEILNTLAAQGYSPKDVRRLLAQDVSEFDYSIFTPK